MVTASEPIVGPGDLSTYWCRKVGRQGEERRSGGPLREVVVARPPSALACELLWETAQRLPRRPGPGAAFAAALTILSADDITVWVRSATPLLEG